MKITIERAAFLKSLNHVQSVVERRNTIPILSNVLLEAKDDQLSLTATDLDIEIVETIGSSISQPGTITAPAHTLYDIVRKLPDGSPDLFFRGFYCWNSEVGAKTLGIASFYLRAVCQNRNLWGVEDFQEISIRHSKYAANRFAHEAAPALTRFADSSPQPFLNGIRQARERIVARNDEDRTDFLRKRGFGKAETAKIVETVLAEEGRPPESVFDFVQGITAYARGKTQQDARLDLETRAKKLLEKV